MSWLIELGNGLRLSKRFFESFLPLADKEFHLGDKINVGAAHVVMASGASARDIKTDGAVVSGTFSRQQLDDIAHELATLRRALREENIPDLEQDADIGAIASAEKAARAGDSNGMLDHLKPVGNWVLDTASKIGIELTVAVIKSALNLP